MTEAVATETPEIPQTPEDALRADIVRVLKTVYDPEIPVNIYDMGLIYGIDLTPVEGAGVENNLYDAHVRMTLTSPNCPAAAELPANVQGVTLTVEGIRNAEVSIVWDPPWTRAMMSEEATLTLGFY